jgi:hypothetical protein
MAVTPTDDDSRVVSLEAYRRERESADPVAWMLYQLGRDAAAGIRMQAGLTSKVVPFRRGK